MQHNQDELDGVRVSREGDKGDDVCAKKGLRPAFSPKMGTALSPPTPSDASSGIEKHLEMKRKERSSRLKSRMASEDTWHLRCAKKT